MMSKDIEVEHFTNQEILVFGVIVPAVFIVVCIFAGGF